MQFAYILLSRDHEHRMPIDQLFNRHCSLDGYHTPRGNYRAPFFFLATGSRLQSNSYNSFLMFPSLSYRRYYHQLPQSATKLMRCRRFVVFVITPMALQVSHRSVHLFLQPTLNRLPGFCNKSFSH